MPKLRLVAVFSLVLGTLGTLAAQDAPAKELHDLQPKIDTAIDRGVQWLLGQQLRDGSWPSYGNYGGGITALTAYTLLKCGLPPAHSAIRRATLHLSRLEPQETYTLGCNLLFLHALADPENKKRMQQLVDRLVTWQWKGFGYPFEGEAAGGGERWSLEDLSNTQYAVLGLRAAAQDGVAIKDEVWLRLAEDVLRYQNRGEVMSQLGTKKVEGAAFRYRVAGPYMGKGTGSMTAAGVAVLSCCEEALGKRMPGELGMRVARAIDIGMAWLAERFVPDQNPDSDGWVLYWLYGVERVGAYRKVELLGKHPWYLEGARFLVGKQQGNGHWADGHVEADTCFALLFLKRASAPATGGGERRQRAVHADEAKASAVRVRAQGGNDGTPLAIWITGFSAKGDLRVREVEYLADDQVIAKVAGDPARAWRQGDDFAARWTIARRGKFKIRARVHLAESGIVLESRGFVLDASQVHEAWMDDAATAASRNLLANLTITATGSTTNSEGQRAELACDGSEATGWCCKKDDPDPWLVLQLDQAVRADTLVLGHYSGKEVDRDGHDKASKVAIKIPSLKEPIVATLGENELEPVVIALPGATTVRRLEVRVLERSPGKRWKGHLGFSEIALELRAKK